jgi:AAA family ATP:ADP antiporter
MDRTLPLRLLTRVVRVEPGEVPALLWSFGYFFCLLCSYYILRPVRDEMGIQGGPENLQWMFTATFLTMLGAVPVFGWLSSRFPRRILLPAVYLFFISNLFIFFFLRDAGITPDVTARVFFVWVSVFNLFVVSVFWSLMADLFRNEQARRLYGFIAAGGSTGALFGPLLVTVLASNVGPDLLLVVSACFLLGALICIGRLGAWTRAGGVNEKRESAAGNPLGGGIFSGLTLLVRSEYLLGIGLYVILYSVLSTFLYFQQAYIVSGAMSDPGERTALFATLDLVVNALTLFCQLFVVGRVIGRFGVTVTLVLLPAVAIVGFFVLGFFPTLAVLIVFGVIRRAGEYAITKPAREVLFTVISREEKYKAKNVIDTVVLRSGDAVSGWLFEGLRILGISFSGVSFVAVPLAALWTITGFLLGRRQEQLRAALLAKRRIPFDEPKTPASSDALDSALDGAAQPTPR